MALTSEEDKKRGEQNKKNAARQKAYRERKKLQKPNSKLRTVTSTRRSDRIKKLAPAASPVSTFLRNIEELVTKEDTFPRWAKLIREATILQTVGVYTHSTPDKRISKFMRTLTPSRMEDLTLVATEFRIFFKNPDGNEMIHLVDIKQSTIPDAGYGVFAAKSFVENEIIGAYVGALTKRDKVQNNVYCMLYDADPNLVIQANGVNQSCPAYFAAHMVNDDKDRLNSVIESDYNWITKRAIYIGEEIFIDYNLDD